MLTYLRENPLLKEAKAFGHLFESISLLHREKRCQKSWGPHRNECRTFISSELKNARHYEKVLVLGSGPLHEIPIELLCQSFKKIVLVDIVHLKSTRESVDHLKNIEFIEHDISEIEHQLRVTKKLFEKIPERFLDQDWGLVLSVNVMSQLPLHLRTYIQKHLKKNFGKDEIDNYLAHSTLNHWHYLQAFSAPALLITDIETFYYDKKDLILHREENYPHLKLPSPAAHWIWNVAPIPEFQKDIGMKMNVCGFVLKKEK